MENTETYLKWCLKQQRGIRLVKPSENLVNAYLEKSRNALRSMEVNAREDIIEWAVSASYYAKYFAVYALLSRVGIRCEIHDCTIALFEHLFGNSVDSQLINEFRKSKKDRIETQYYTRKVNIELNQLMKKTKDFVLEIEKILDDMNSEKIGQLQSVLNKLKIKD
jgi:uncharacterized protein (UPF0332 family)